MQDNRLITDDLKEGDPTAPSLTLKETGERMVIDAAMAVGAIIPPDEFFEEIGEEPGGTVDILVLSLTTLDKERYEFILPPKLSYEISMSMHDWVGTLIDAKRIPCPCKGCS